MPRPTARFLHTCALLAPLLLAACWWQPSPEKLYQTITQGQPEAALESIQSQLQNTTNPPQITTTLNALAALAHVTLCAQNTCNPKALSTHLATLSPQTSMSLNPNISPTTASLMLQPAFNQITSPTAILALMPNLPNGFTQLAEAALFHPALTQARSQKFAASGQALTQLATTTNLPTTTQYSAQLFAGIFTNQPTLTQAHIISLRSVNGQVPAAATALLPWAMLATTSSTNAALQGLIPTTQSWKIPKALPATSMYGAADELLRLSQNPTLRAPLQNRWQGPSSTLVLTLQRLSLNLNPNQPELWESYLTNLTQKLTASTTTSSTLEQISLAEISPTLLTSATQTALGTQLLVAAQRLENQPTAAAPLVTLAASLPLSNPQKIEVDKLTQSLLLKAAENSDVTTTLILAGFKPDVALSNRQTIVPLLVGSIRQNLHAQRFTEAVNTFEFLQNTLKMDVEMAPIILQEFTDEAKATKLQESLTATTPELLLQPANDVAQELTPLFTFMQDYFADQPNIITAQLNPLIAGAAGTYGPATAMYRLGNLFPDATMPATKRQQWLHQAIINAVLEDESLTPAALATLATQLAAVHEGLNVSPLLEAALKRTNATEETREIWQNATPATRQLLAAMRPQFSSLMQAIDALQANQPNQAAQFLHQITDSSWQAQAEPYLQTFYTTLQNIAGLYVPASPTPASNIAAIILTPQAMASSTSPLNAVNAQLTNRMGTLTTTSPETLTQTPSTVENITLPLSFNFTTRTLTPTPEGPTTSLTTITLGTNLLQLTEGPLTTPFTRLLTKPTDILRPDGTYLIQAPLNTPLPGTQTILPIGSILTLQTTTSPDANGTYALTGTLMHPASSNGITLEGSYTPTTFTSQFTFTYPLPSSGQPVKATTRCQTLGGPIICGSHHLHSPRQQFATLVSGMQTRESLALTAQSRQQPAMATVTTSPTTSVTALPATPSIAQILARRPAAMGGVWRRAGQHHRAAPQIRRLHRHIAGVVPKRFILLIAWLMLLIHHHQLQVAKG